MLGRRTLPSLNHVLKNISRPASTSTSKADNNATSSALTKKVDVPLPTTQQQSPNYPSTWSTSQRPRPGIGSSPRFEQTAMDLQPNPLSAMELIAKEPIRVVHGRKAVCDGGKHMFLSSPVTFHHLPFILGGGPLGHPKIYINLVGVATQQNLCFFSRPCSFIIDRTGSAWTSCMRVCKFYCYSLGLFIQLNVRPFVI